MRSGTTPASPSPRTPRRALRDEKHCPDRPQDGGAGAGEAVAASSTLHAAIDCACFHLLRPFMTSSIPSRVRLIDVGPVTMACRTRKPRARRRQGRAGYRLQAGGAPEIEVTSYVSPKWVPQMGDNHEVMSGIARQPAWRIRCSRPTSRALRRRCSTSPTRSWCSARPAGAFSQRNINCSIAEALSALRPWCKLRWPLASACAAR